jgi:hypothetical protein
MHREEGGFMSGWFSTKHRRRLGRQRATDRIKRYRAAIEDLEDRRLLVSRVFLDFGDQFRAAPNNDPYTGTDVIRGLTPATINGALVGGNGPNGVNHELDVGLLASALALQNPNTVDFVSCDTLANFNANAGLIDELAITTQIRRALEPYDIQVLSSAELSLNINGNFFGSRTLADASAYEAMNNLTGDFGAPAAGTATIPQFGSDDVYVYIVGLFQVVPMSNPATAEPIEQLNGAFPISTAFKVNVPAPFSVPNRVDTGAVIDANYFLEQAVLEQQLGVPNASASVAIANAAMYAIGFGYGLTEVEDGFLATDNYFQDTNIQFTNQSSAMLQGGQPSFTEPQFFNRNDYMLDGIDLQKLLRPGTLGNPTILNLPPFPYNPNSIFPIDEATINDDPNVTTNAYDSLVNDPDIGRSPDVEFVSGTAAFDKITITRSGPNTALATVDSYLDNTFSGQLIASKSYTLNLSKIVIPGRADDGVPFHILVEGCNNDDQVIIDPRLGTAVEVDGGSGVMALNITGDGVMNAVYTPAIAPSILFDGVTPAQAGTLVITGTTSSKIGTTTIVTPFTTTVNLEDFNTIDGSALKLDNFNKLTYKSPARIDNAFTVTEPALSSGIWSLGGQIVTTAAENGSVLMTNVKQLEINTAFGPTIDSVSFATNGEVATGLQKVIIAMGDGAGDLLSFDDAGSLENLRYTVSQTSLVVQQPQNVLFNPGFTGYDFSGVETLSVTGTTGNNDFRVTPSLTTEYIIDGLDPPIGTLPPDGDSLTVRVAGTTGFFETDNGLGTGSWTFADHQPILFNGIENVVQPIPNVLAVSGSSDATISKPLVKVYDALQTNLLYSFYAYPVTFGGGVRVAVADVNGDFVPDIITVPGPGRAAEVKVFDGAILAGLVNAQHFVANPAAALLADFKSEGAASTYTAGLYVAAADIDGDGSQDIVTSRARGATRVRVFANDGTGTAFTQVATWAPYSASLAFGAVVAAGDTDGDGLAEVITAPGAGTTVQVRVFDGLSGTVLRRFNGFENTFKFGVSIEAADFDGDGKAEIALAAGKGGSSRVRILDASLGTLEREFKPFTTNTSAAVRIAAVDPDGSGVAQLYAAQALGGATHDIRLFDPLSGDLVDQLLETSPDLKGGINVA